MAAQRRIYRCVQVSVLAALLVACSATLGYGADTSGTAVSTPGASEGGGSPFREGITSDDYVILADDILTIDGHQYSELSPMRTYTVAKDGTIKLVYIGRVPASGLTKRKLEESLEERYKKFFRNPVINVTVRSKNYAVVGEVRSPGIFPLQLKTTILTAIARASGFTDYGDQGDVIIIRTVAGGAPKRHRIDCKAILKGKAEDFPIEPNDVIWVQRKGPFG
jgi:polysaccharide export outer membrane protein